MICIQSICSQNGTVEGLSKSEFKDVLSLAVRVLFCFQ